MRSLILQKLLRQPKVEPPTINRQGGQRGNGEVGGVEEGIVAPEGVGEAEGFFGIEGVVASFADGIQIGIAEAVIDRGETGGTGIGEPGDLDRGDFAGEDARAALGHVHGEVNEDVDAVFADELGELLIVEVGGVAPGVGVGTDALGDGVGVGDVRVEENFEVLVVMGGEERNGEEGLAVVAEVGGDVADAEAAMRVTIVGRGAEGTGEVGGETLIPLGVFLVDRLGIVLGEELETEEEVLGGGEIGADFNGGAEEGESFIKLANDNKGAGEVGEGFGIEGAEFDRAAIGGDGVFDFFLLAQGVAEVVVGFGIAGAEFDGAVGGGDGGDEFAGFEEGGGEVVVGFG